MNAIKQDKTRESHCAYHSPKVQRVSKFTSRANRAETPNVSPSINGLIYASLYEIAYYENRWRRDL